MCNPDDLFNIDNILDRCVMGAFPLGFHIEFKILDEIVIHIPEQAIVLFILMLYKFLQVFIGCFIACNGGRCNLLIA